LTGYIPNEIELLTYLETLYSSDNSISGTIPSNILNLTNITIFSLYNTSIVRDSIPKSYDSVIVEPCIICDGAGNFDFVESFDENGISLADEWSASINDIRNNVPWNMLTTKECSLLTERCIICHEDNSKNQNDHGNSYESMNISNSTRKFISNDIP